MTFSVDEHMKKWRAEQDAIADIMVANRTSGLAICILLDNAQQVWLETGDKAKALDALRNAWLNSQDSLLVFEKAHAGALKYFVDIKDAIKRQIEGGVLPKGYPRKKAPASPTDPAAE